MKDRVYKFLPHLLQESIISLYNYINYRIRYGGVYKDFKEIFCRNRFLTRDVLLSIQRDRFNSFLKYAVENSNFYRSYPVVSLDDIGSLPIVNKERLRNDIRNVYSVKKSKGIISKTGGTTGKSLEVLFTHEDMQERFALLDYFRSQFGYKLGKRTAWFSGKNLLTHRDVKKFRFWKTDYLYRVRYYSTFHIRKDYLKYYVENLLQYQPEYLVGFPSTILEIAKFGLKHNYAYPEGVTQAIFPTAEMITSEMRLAIEAFFHCKIYDQYASSEGAPFIFECEFGNLHLELQSGVFEVLDEFDKPTKSGRLVVTSFTTKGTPLIRYDIGDELTLYDGEIFCKCGNENPIVKQILGRIDDFIFSPEIGKINLGNVSNTLKDVQGIIRFQAIQDDLNDLELLVVKDDNSYNSESENRFIQNWRDRIGNKMNLKINYVEEIRVEKGGKFRIVKNSIKKLID